MPGNAGNIGADYFISYYDADAGALVNLGDVQDIHITELKTDIKSAPYNNDVRYDYIDNGFKIDFTFIRTGPTLEDMMVRNSANLKAGKVRGAGYLNESINNADGSISRYQYTNFVFFLTDHGDISREKIVNIKGEGMASAKIPIA